MNNSTARLGERLQDLSGEESRALGPVLAAASEALKRHGNVDQVYALLYNEGHPGHVHFHVVPRFVGEADFAQALPDELPPGASIDIDAAARDVSDHLGSTREERSALVRALRSVSSRWNQYVSLYRLFLRLPARNPLDAGESYVSFWMALWGAGLATALMWPVAAVAWVIGILAVYRWMDMGLYEVGILLKMEESSLQSVPRSLLLKVGNLVEIWLVLAGFLAARGAEPDGQDAVVQGFRVSALQPSFSDGGIVANLPTALAWSLVLLAVSGGIAMLIGKIADTFYEGD